MTKHSPTDLDGVRAEIAQTSIDFARRVEKLVAKSDMPTRVRSTALDGMDTAKDVAASAAHQAGVIAGGAVRRVHAGVDALRSSMEDRDVRFLVRRSAPLGAILSGVAAVGVGIYLMARRRH
jgi:hypothetical protein